MALELALRELSDGLKSPRITDRKRNAENLKEFLTRNAVPSLLTENTLKKKGYTWNHLFEDLHEFILKETEKYETSKTYDSVTRPLCTSLLHLCVAGSNKGQAYIKFDKITEACLLILRDSRLRKAIGDAYLDLLYKYILPTEYYLGFITPVSWEELLDVCLSASLSSSSKLDSYTKLRLVLLLIRNATTYCQFVIPLRESLPKFKKCFEKVSYDKKAQEVVVEILIVLLETLSIECRLTMCNFTENVLGTTLKFYDQNMDHKKKSMLFHLLHHTVSLHHPQGRIRNEEGSRADDWDVWNKQLNSFLEIMCLEATYLQKIRKPTDDLLKQCTHFCNLSAAVYFQIFSLSESVENEAQENSSKRLKLSFNKNKTFADLIDELQQNHVPWLGIVHMYVKNHPKAISTDDYISLTKVIQILVTCNQNMNWDVVGELSCIVLENVMVNADCRKEDCDKNLLLLWNSCVRNSTAVNTAHKAIHTIMQHLITLDVIKYQYAQAIFKFYIDKGMPVTNHSVATLNTLFHKFYSKYSYDDVRKMCYLWFFDGDFISVNGSCVVDLLYRLISNDNIKCKRDNHTEQNLYNTLFNSIEECILFSEFQLEIRNPANDRCINETPEVNTEIAKEICNYLNEKFVFCMEEFEKKTITLADFMEFINIVANYLDITLKCNIYSSDQIKTTGLFRLLNIALSQMYHSVECMLKSDNLIATKIKLVQILRTILLADLGPLMGSVVRMSIHKEFFITLNKILITETKANDEDLVYAGDEKEMNATTLKHNCVLVLAAYCRRNVNFRDELLNFILDPKIYDFATDSLCMFQCLEMLYDDQVEDPPLESLFTLMQFMCKDLYRNPKASCWMLKHLIKMLDNIWSSETTMKQNCLIMIKSYMQRCGKLHYPPTVAGLVYKCLAKIAMLNRKHNFGDENTFETALMGKIKGDIHSLRLYCCYLLKLFIGEFSEDEIDFFLAELLEIFVVKVSEREQHVLQDESANRTSAVLHCFLALVQTKQPLVQKIITSILQIQKDKSLNVRLVKKVLVKIVNTVGIKDFDSYIDKNIVSIFYYWFSKNNTVDELPVELLGCDSLDVLLEKHKKWLITTDILWQRGGEINDSYFLKKSGVSAGRIIETCFCNIIMLCLPYLAMEKYHINFIGSEHPNTYKKSKTSAKKMFQQYGQMLKNEKWTNLFVENVGDLVLETASYLCDRTDAKQIFGVNIPEQTHSYYYPKNVFSAILDYIGDLTDGNIMLYLCENQPIAIFQVIFSLWKTVLDEKVMELKVLAVHAFITFLEFVPFGVDSDAFVCNYACKSFAHSIRDCHSKDEMKTFVKGAEVVLKRFLPDRVYFIRKSVTQLMTILVIKKEEGFEMECKALFDYLVVDMKHYLKDSEDVVDFVSSISGGTVDNASCSTLPLFLAKLKTHRLSLNYPSPEILLNLRNFLSTNKHYVNALYNKMSPKGFSEDCESSYIHQIVHSLNNILKSTQFDDKIKLEACDCLSEIGTYDLKTLVTVAPIATTKVVDLEPKQYIACTVLKSLSEVAFDEDPTVTSKVADTLTSLLKFREGSDALDLEQVDKEILKPLKSGNDMSCDFKINSRHFDKYCCGNGIFITSMTRNWNPNNTNNHCDWLKQVTTTLLRVIEPTANYFESLLHVCYTKSNICQKILPPLVGLIIQRSSEEYIDVLSKQINNFFSYIWEQTFDRQTDDAGDASQINIRISNTLDIGQKMVVQYMLDVVDFIRLQRRYYKTRPDRTMETLNYLRLEYDKVAWAAAVADQNLAAIYYGELWAVSRNGGVPPSSPEATTILPGGANIQQIFRKCYVSIGESDAIDGCGTAHLTIESEKRKHLINTGQYADALLLHDIALSCGAQLDHNLQCGAVRSLHKSGMHHLALQYIKSLPENDDLNDIKYECLSFLGDWSEIVDTRDLEDKSKQLNCNPNSIIKALHYACLKDCLNIQITPDMHNKMLLPLNRAKLAVSRLCMNLNMENCQNVYKVVGKLHLFTDIEDYFSVRINEMSTGELLTKWNVENLPIFNDFKHLESLISQRVLILDHAAKSATNMQDDIVDLQIKYARLCLSNHRVQMAQRLLAVVKKWCASEEIALAESEISWAKGHKEIALSLLRTIVSDQSENEQLTARSLRQYALWMVESKRDSAREIIEKYLLKSLEVLNRGDHVETRLKVYHDIAKFADTECKQVVSYMSSSIFENKVKVMENMKATSLTLKSNEHSLTKDERKAFFVNDRFKALEEVEIASTRAEKESFLHLAMRYYLLSLKQCEENNLSIFRVISLWLDNPSFEFDEQEQCKFEHLLHAIPSRKFITVLPQLAPRLTDEDTPFAENLRKILQRCAFEHPHHTLPILFALKNSEKDKVIMNASGAVGGSTPRIRSQEPRTIAAETLVTKLANTSTEMKIIIAQMEKICDATISFANYKPKKKDAKQAIPAAEQLHKLKNLDAIPIPIVTIPVRSDCKYLHFPTLMSFENYFELVGGINCPKKVTCTDSSGHKRILLIKGEDDMRQDAVMQQVFNIVNTLLEKNLVTSRNKLLIRTYKVVPMSKQSGVLEWCEGTIPVGAYLIGGPSAPGAHARYRPQDISCSVARKKLNDCHDARKSNKEKLTVFNRILKEFRPVFHFFFTEHYLDPVTWYERRLAYTKSVATTSMVGYIMGLGDRHVQNILIDKKTAEVIHIDFGIAFDQGKTLHTPETVPFRLTQDMIAGFGSSGVEGIFRRCCEKTLLLLRDNSETLLTILEVLLCDPLYSWTVTTAQQNVSTSRNTSVHGACSTNSGLAERALLAVSSKLSGTDGGLAGGVAVPGQVARLLHCATDNANLCRLYPGWQPYL